MSVVLVNETEHHPILVPNSTATTIMLHMYINLVGLTWLCGT